MSKTGKNLISFDVKNGQYAIGGALKPLGFLAAFAKEKSLDTKAIYGDGELQVEVFNDKGYTHTMTLTAQDEDYNKDLGISLELEGGGIATVTQHQSIEHAIYFETYDMVAQDDKSFKKTTAKVWAFGITAGAPSETLNQTTEGINDNSVDYAGTIKGTLLMDSTGENPYVDENGLTYKVFTYKKRPDDVGYADFEKTVPIPKKSIL